MNLSRKSENRIEVIFLFDFFTMRDQWVDWKEDILLILFFVLAIQVSIFLSVTIE